VSASPTGSTAARKAPKATSRIPSASGTAVHSACWKSLPIVSLNHLLAEPSPNSSIRRPGWARRTAAAASSSGCTRSAAVIASPVIETLTSTECPSAETSPSAYGSLVPVTRFVACNRASRSATAARTPGSVADPELLTRNISPAGTPSPAASRISIAFAELPVAYSFSVICRWPEADPSATANATKTSQPTMASARCRTLQPPTAAATFRSAVMTELHDDDHHPYAHSSPRRPTAGEPNVPWAEAVGPGIRTCGGPGWSPGPCACVLQLAASARRSGHPALTAPESPGSRPRWTPARRGERLLPAGSRSHRRGRWLHRSPHGW
jgi:hypothetical protein